MASRQIARALRVPLGGTKIRSDVEGLNIAEIIDRLSRLRTRFLAVAASQRIVRLVDRFGRALSDDNEDEQARILPVQPVRDSPQIRAALAVFQRNSVNLISSIMTQQADDVERLIMEAAASGMRIETLRDRISDRFGIARRRAAIIARDQLATSNGRLTQLRQEAAGVLRYRWSTSGDERVRASHDNYDGREFSWSSPPPEGHPGVPILCRCVAIPVL